ncbi:Protein C09H10.9 [Aphelenchoides avenae]|nr:Protein C09H10.9 [Aphelenchus avenae]
MANAIVDGNEIYPVAVEKTGGKQVFTIPVALACCKYDLRELNFCVVRGFVGSTLVKFLNGACRGESLAEFKQIFFILIIFERAVTIVYERTSDTIGFMDPHTHDSCGAVIACAPFTDLQYFVAWLASEIFGESFFIPYEYQCFELSVVSFDGKLSARDRPLDYPVPRISNRARTQIFPARAPEEIWSGRPKEYSELMKMASRKVYRERMSRLRKAISAPNNSQAEDPFGSSG